MSRSATSIPKSRSNARTPTNGTDPAHTREIILNAARQLFAELGYSRTSMQAIAKRAGVARATVYNNFADKAKIVSLLVAEYMEGYVYIGERLQRAADPNETVFQLLERTVREAITWRVANADLRPAIDAAKHIRGSGWMQMNAAADEALLGWIGEIHRANARAGLTRPRIDVDLATSSIYSMIEATLSSFPVDASPEQIGIAASQLSLLHWYALYDLDPEMAPRVEQVMGDGRSPEVSDARRRDGKAAFNVQTARTEHPVRLLPSLQESEGNALERSDGSRTI